jgi:hypothetical protein
MRKTLTITLGVILTLFSLNASAAIKFFSDYPNSTPLDSDLFVLQRNSSYINSSPAQVRQTWFNTPVFTGVMYGDGSGLTNLSALSQTVSNFNATYITNFVEYTTNLFASTEIVTNLYVSTEIVTNLYVTNFFALNGNFIDNNGGQGTNITLWGTTSFDELDVTTAVITNLYTLITNAPLLSTDGDGKVQASNFLVATNNDTVVSNGLYAQITASGPANLANATNETTRQINSLTNNVAASNIISGGLISASVMDLIRATNEVTRQINSATNIYASLGSAVSGMELATNFSYIVKTNNGGGNALVGGASGTAATVYLTNITAATTLASFTWPNNVASGIKMYATCSGGTDRILTFPNGCTGAGLGTPPAVTVTNAKAAWFDVICIPGVNTNVFWSPVY